MRRPPHRLHRLVRQLALVLTSALVAASGSADVIDQARRMHDRLVGTPPSPATLSEMVTLMGVDPHDAAERAMQEPAFYNVALKNFVTPWTNEEQTVFADLNDYTALVIGLVRDERDFREVLTGDIAYVADLTTTPVTAAYSQFDNVHYEQIQDLAVDLSDPAQLVMTEQSTLPNAQIGPNDAAGVITTRQAGMAFFRAGTNRRMWRFTSMNYLCRDLEQMKDVSRPADRVRQDVNRSPGGDSEIFHSECIGCHSGMDPLAGAFAYFEWDDVAGRVIHTPGQVQQKNLINSNSFPGGYVTVDNRWDNFWRSGTNASLGWRAAGSGGYGPQSLGREVAESRAFAVCQVEKVFEQVCFRQPRDATEVQLVRDIATDFENSTYRMKTVFARVAVHCMGN